MTTNCTESVGAFSAQGLCAAAERSSVATRLIALLATLGVAYIARDLVVPIVLAALLALLLRPGLRPLRRLGMPDSVAAFVLVAGVAAAFTFTVLALAGQAQNWLSQAPDMVRKVSSMLPTKLGPLSDLERTKAAVKDLAATSETPSPLPVEVQSNDMAYAVLGVSSHFVASAVIVFVLGYFLLALSGTLLKQAIESRATFNEKKNIVQLVHNIEQGISRYLLTVTVINAGLGVATGFLLWLLGIPNPALWGVLAGISNYVPHVGAFVCMSILFFVGAVTHESIGYGLLTGGAFAVLTSLESYFITPYALSKSLHLSPLATIVAILTLGWLWGVSGGLMAAPLLAVLKITCDQFETLKGWRWLFAASAKESPAAAAAPDGAAGLALAPHLGEP